MRATGTEKRGDGFTLVELLIALAMISLIALLLFSGLRLGLRAWESVDAAAEQIGELRLAHGFLARILSQARVASTLVEAETVAIFGGDAEGIEFAAPLSDQVGVSGLYVLRLTLEDRGDARALVLTRWLLHPEVMEGGDGFPPWEPLDKDGARSVADLPVDLDAADGAFGRTLLLDRVDAFEILYHGLAEGETEPDWHEDWFEQPNPPTQLRIRLTTAARTWPDLVIALPGRRS